MHELGKCFVDNAIDPLVTTPQYIVASRALSGQLDIVPRSVLLHGRPMNAYTSRVRSIVEERAQKYYDFCAWINQNWLNGDRDRFDRIVVDRAADQYARTMRMKLDRDWDSRWAVAKDRYLTYQIIDFQDPTLVKLLLALQTSALMQYVEASTDPNRLRPFLLQ
ncbi:MAG: hypothetical protein NUV65_04855 [Candidatus Roizmanbacteria bacterium]|nr:hypothetical protein [Candidatus Roizmanbacteria bacterium]